MSGYGTAFTGTDIVLSVDNLWCDPCRDGGGSHKTGKKLIWYEVLLFCLSVLLPVTFYYLTYQEVHFVLLLWGIGEGAISVLWLQFGYPHFSHLREQEVNDIPDGYYR